MSELENLIKKSIEEVKNMTPEEREAMYAEQCKPHNPFENMPSEDLLHDLDTVNNHLNDKLEWGSSITALIEWKQELERELRRRGLTVS